MTPSKKKQAAATKKAKAALKAAPSTNQKPTNSRLRRDVPKKIDKQASLKELFVTHPTFKRDLDATWHERKFVDIDAVGGRLIQEGFYRAAAEFFETLAKMKHPSPVTAILAYRRAEAEYGRQRFKHAYEFIVKADPLAASTCTLAGTIALKRRQSVLAARWFMRALLLFQPEMAEIRSSPFDVEDNLVMSWEHIDMLLGPRQKVAFDQTPEMAGYRYLTLTAHPKPRVLLKIIGKTLG